MLTCIRRANLDAFWSQAPRTMSANLQQLIHNYNFSMQMSHLSNPLFALGNPSLEDSVGMYVALMTLHASLRPGKYVEHLQYVTTQKTPTCYTHIHNASSAYSIQTLYSRDERKVHISMCLT